MLVSRIGRAAFKAIFSDRHGRGAVPANLHVDVTLPGIARGYVDGLTWREGTQFSATCSGRGIGRYERHAINRYKPNDLRPMLARCQHHGKKECCTAQNDWRDLHLQSNVGVDRHAPARRRETYAPALGLRRLAGACPRRTTC